MTVTNTSPPIRSGQAVVGQQMSTTNGTWTFDLNYLTYAYQWVRCDAAGANCVDISGATSATYLVTGADVGSTIRSEVTATEHSSVAGTLMDSFTDFTDTQFGTIFINRWNPQGGNAYQPLSPNGANWSTTGGPSITEVSPNGPGFQFICNDQMQSQSDRKMTFIRDVGTIITGGSFDVTFDIRFTSAGNPTGFANFGDWNALAQVPDSPGVQYNQVGIDNIVGGGPKFYVRSYFSAGNAPAPGNGFVRKAHGPVVAYNQWYEIHWAVNLTTGGGGTSQFFVDGVQYANWTGATCPGGGCFPEFRFGYYTGREDATNKIEYTNFTLN